MVVYIVSLPCANFYVHSCCISGVLLICTCVFGYFQVHQVSLLKKIITCVFQKLFSSNNFFLALKSIFFHPRTSLYPPPLGFCVGGVAKLMIEKATLASFGIIGVAPMYVRVNQNKQIYLFGLKFTESPSASNRTNRSIETYDTLVLPTTFEELRLICFGKNQR